MRMARRPAILSVGAPRHGRVRPRGHTQRLLGSAGSKRLHPSIIPRFGGGFIFSTVNTVDSEDRRKWNSSPIAKLAPPSQEEHHKEHYRRHGENEDRERRRAGHRAVLEVDSGYVEVEEPHHEQQGQNEA